MEEGFSDFEFLDFQNEELEFEIKGGKSNKRQKNYFTEASRKARRLQRKTRQFLKVRNEELETEIYFLKCQASNLEKAAIEISVTRGTISRNDLLRENKILKEEVRKTRLFSDVLKSQIERTNYLHNSIIFNSIVNKNVGSILNKLEYLMVASLQQEPFQVKYSKCDLSMSLDTLIQDGLHARGFKSVRKAEGGQDLTSTSFRHEARSYSNEENDTVVRLDFLDVPIQSQRLIRFLRRVNDLALLMTVVKMLDQNKKAEKEIGNYREKINFANNDPNDMVTSAFLPVVHQVEFIQQPSKNLISISAAEVKDDQTGCFVQTTTTDLLEDFNSASAFISKGFCVSPSEEENCCNVTFIIQTRLERKSKSETNRLLKNYAIEGYSEESIPYSLMVERVDLLLQLCAKYV